MTTTDARKRLAESVARLEAVEPGGVGAVSAVRARRYADAQAVTWQARGDLDRQREWLDLLALMDQADARQAGGRSEAVIKAEALDEAAAEWHSPIVCATCMYVDQWLRDRAAALRAQNGGA